MARDKAAQAERVAWERAAQNMRVALIGFAKEKEFISDVAASLGLFWQDRYAADTIHLMNVDESLRFFDWFAQDYTLGDRDERLIEIYRRQMADTLDEKEAVILDGWIDSLPGSAFVLEDTDGEQGTVLLRDLFLPDRRVTVQDQAAAKHGQVGQILLSRPVPEHDRLRFSGATVVLPAEEQDALKAFVEDARAQYLRDHPETTMAQFLRERAYLLTHYALEWAEREGRPAVAAQDPEARRPPGSKFVQKLIKWSVDRQTQ